MLMIHIHFIGCQYIKRFIFFGHQNVSQQVRNSTSLTFKLEIDFWHCHHDKAMLVILSHFILLAREQPSHVPHTESSISSFQQVVENFLLKISTSSVGMVSTLELNSTLLTGLKFQPCL